MASNFPVSLDDLANPSSSAPLNSPDHATQHGLLNDGLEAVQAKVGVDSSAVATSLDYKVRTNLTTATTYTDTAITALLAATNTLSTTLAASASTYRTSLGLVIGTNVQAYNAQLAALALGSLLLQQQYLFTQSVNAQTGTTYTLVASDSTKLVTQSNASAITTTVPQDSDVTWAIGAWCELFQLGAGQITVAAGTGATLRTTPTAKSSAQYARLFLQKISANTWSLSGSLAAS